MGKVPDREEVQRPIPKMVPLVPANGEFIPLASVIPEAIRERFAQLAAKRGR